MFLLHSHEHGAGVLSEVFLEGFIEALELIPFLFITYLLIEYIEHRAGGKVEDFVAGRGRLAPVFGALAGALPQCGFSAAASSLYSSGVITLGTLIAVFLSTSDEMLPILLSGNVSLLSILAILGYKVAVAMIVGLVIDLVIRKKRSKTKEVEQEHSCHCEECERRGIFASALIHTLKISAFVLLITVAINALMFFTNEEELGSVISSLPVLGHLLAAIFGLIPNCAASVALATLARGGIISAGQMLSGLFSGAGVGMAVLVSSNKSRRENALIILTVVAVGVVFGILADLIMPGVLTW